MASETVYWGQRALAEISSIGTAMANVSGAVGQTSLLVTGNINSSNSVSTGNLIANNIIMSSNMSTNTGYGNVYLSGNLVVTGNIFSSGAPVLHKASFTLWGPVGTLYPQPLRLVLPVRP